MVGMNSSAPVWFALLAYLAATFSAGATGAFFKPGPWYMTLSKPVWTPPNWLFPIAWTLLYILMAIAVWWVSMTSSIWTLPAVALWTWQMVLNALWSPVFFGLRQLGSAMVVILFLWLAIALTIFAFWQVSHFAAYLMLPYLVWVSYASALNFSLWSRNREVQALA